MRKYIFKFKGLLFLACFFQIITASTPVICAFLLKYLVDFAAKGDFNNFMKSVGLFILFCVGLFFINSLSEISKTIYTKHTMIYIKNDIFHKITNRDIKKFNEENSANYLSILNNDIAMINRDGVEITFTLIYDIFSFLTALISVLYLNIYITIVIAILGGLSFYVPQLFSKKISAKREAYSSSLEDFTATTKDIFSGFEVIKSFNILNKISSIYSNNNQNVEIKKKNFAIYNSTVDSLAEFMSGLLFAAPLAIGGYFVIKGETSLGTLVALVQLIGQLISPISSSSKVINRIKSLKPILNKIDNLSNDEVKENPIYTLESFNKSIEFKNLDFSYDGSKKALKNINQTFEKGRKYALVGGSGSGKSTILRLLLRYYEEFNGSILIDGKKHTAIDINDIFKNISVIQQNVFMFDGTIKDNISLYGNYSDKDVLNAAKRAGLINLIENLPNGIYEYVGENGSKLSGGEKQRIAIARSLIKNSNIMLLDESTSALDNETAYNIEKSILELDGVTSIVITHKLIEEILIKYDEIVVMRDGFIVERGTFNDLLSNKGYFYSLYNVGQTVDYKTENTLAC